MTLEEKIEQARRHVESGRRIVERQRVIAARLGNETSTDLLARFEQTQLIFEADLLYLLGKRQAAPPFQQAKPDMSP
jgi:hypothetical protein